MTAAALGEGALPPLLAVSTANAATLFAAGLPLTETVGDHVLALAREVLMSMSITKVKLASAVALVTALFAALIGGAFLPMVSAQDKRKSAEWYLAQAIPDHEKAETDEAFIRRISKDLREVEPTPAEVHFFAATKDRNKRRKLIDLFIEERQAKRDASLKSAMESALEKEVRLEVFVLKHAAADEVAKALAKLVEKKGIRVVAEPVSNRVLVQAGKADMDSVKKLVGALDALAEPKEGEFGRRK